MDPGRAKTGTGGEAARGEFFAFQVGLYAVATNTQDISVRFSDLRASKGGRGIPSSAIRCFNTGGTNWSGAAFTKAVSVEKGRVQALWFGVQVPQDVAPGSYQGRVTIKPAGLPAQSVKLALTVTAPLSPIPGMMSQGGSHDCAGWIPRSLLTMALSALSPPSRLRETPLKSLGDGWQSARPGFPRR